MIVWIGVMMSILVLSAEPRDFTTFDEHFLKQFLLRETYSDFPVQSLSLFL